MAYGRGGGRGYLQGELYGVVWGSQGESVCVRERDCVQRRVGLLSIIKANFSKVGRTYLVAGRIFRGRLNILGRTYI